MGGQVLVADAERNAEVEYRPAVLDPAGCSALWTQLVARRESFRGGPKLTTSGWSETPRLSAAFGDHAVGFVDMDPCMPWFDELASLRSLLAASAGHGFNYALVNWYRDGRDHAGWHADKAQFHVAGSSIAIVSLGAVRTFCVRDAQDRSISSSVAADPGSVIWMRGATQDHYEHAVPASDEDPGERLSITFRLLLDDLFDDRPARPPDA